MKTVLVTGGSRGIGTAICTLFAEQGYAVAVNYNKSEEEAYALARRLYTEYNAPCAAFRADVSESAQVKKMFSEIREQLGHIDVLINNAGISSRMLFTNITDEIWRKNIGVNLDGVFYCCREAAREMVSRKQGSIINISSMWGQVGASCEVHYSAAKAGVIGLTKALAKELAPSGVRVNCIAPGVIMTDMMNSFDERTKNELRDETPLLRLGSPMDIAKAALFLARDSSSFVTGQILGVNGGFII